MTDPRVSENVGVTRGGAVPPRSLEAERSVLGELLMNNSAWETIDGVIQADDFYDAAHRKVFRCISDLMDTGSPADMITVGSRMRDNKTLDEVGGSDFLADLTDVPSGGRNLKGHAQIIRDCAVLRELISVNEEIRDSAFHPGAKSPREVIDEAESRLLAVSARQDHLHKSYQPIADFSGDVMDTISKLAERRPGDVIGVPTGFADLDTLTSGLQPNELVIIAGRPGMGKTSLAMDIAKHVSDPTRSSEHGHGVMMFSLEMSGEQLMTRLLGNMGRIDYHKLRTGKLSSQEIDGINDTIGRIEGLDLYIDDTGDIDVMQIKAKARRLQREMKKRGRRLTMVVVDYLQLVRGGSGSDSIDNRAQVVSAITRGLKMLARELNIVVVAMSQLNRALETRHSKRPMLADLRESGAIEQDADLIMFLYRESEYNRDLPEEEATKAEIIVGKHRNGPTGMVEVTFLKQFASFRNRARPSNLPEY